VLVDLADLDFTDFLDLPGVENIYLFSLPDTYGKIFSVLKVEQVAKAWRVGRWAWETPLFPEDWKFAEALIHELWTPSEFCSSVFRTKLAISVRTIAHAVAVPSDNRINIRERLGVPDHAFLGLAIMDLSSCPQRKNPWAHVAAWKNWFGTDQQAVLVMKVRTTKRTAVVLRELNELIDGAPNIILLTTELSNEEISALHRSADLYLSLHRSEGFGLAIYEALLAGKTVAATDWSAPAEYGSKFPNYIPVPFQLVPYSDWTGYYGRQRFMWAEALPGAVSTELLRKPAERPELA